MTEKNEVNSVMIPFSSHKKCPKTKKLKRRQTLLSYFGQMTETSQGKKTATNNSKRVRTCGTIGNLTGFQIIMATFDPIMATLSVTCSIHCNGRCVACQVVNSADARTWLHAGNPGRVCESVV